MSTAYNPHSNLRAETAVRSMKRLVRENTGQKGELDTDKIAMAMLMYRNTPDPDTGLSPAQVLYARQLRDTQKKEDRSRRKERRHKTNPH